LDALHVLQKALVVLRQSGHSQRSTARFQESRKFRQQQRPIGVEALDSLHVDGCSARRRIIRDELVHEVLEF
jgi:hypothetical protein